MKPKNKIIKLFSLTLSTMLICALSLTNVFAIGSDNGNDKSIIIENGKTGHTYEAYQIITGDLDGSTLTNLAWGSNVDQSKLTTANGFSSNKVNAVAKDMSNANAETYAAAFNKVLTGNPAASVNTPGENGYVLSGLTQGYYLIKDKDASQNNKNDAETLYILAVTTDNLTVKPKSSVPTVEKFVLDVNDDEGYPMIVKSTSSEYLYIPGWEKSADYDIGDAVPFKLVATLPIDNDNGHGFSDYETYYLQFTDTTSTGLTLPANTSDYDIYIDSHKLNDSEKQAVGASITVSEDGHTLTVTINNVKEYNRTHAGSEVIVTYDATLNGDAVTGTAGNTNTVELTFSNNPNGTGNGKTEPDVNKVYTYAIKLTKQDENNQPLSGATFHLEKAYPSLDNPNGSWETVAAPVRININNNIFTVEGIDDGTYRLVEDTAPRGYAKIENIEFTVSATHSLEALTDLTATITNASSIKTGEAGAFTATLSTGELATIVKDAPAVELPATGGKGAMAIIGLGIACLLAYGCYEIVSRRKEEELQ